MTDPYQCPTCRERYVVPSLADQCHKRHQEDK